MVYFGQQLESFSKAIDIVTDEVRENILLTVQRKLETSLGIRFLTLHRATLIDNNIEGLITTEWLVGGDRFDGPVTIHRSDNSYASQVSLAFGNNKQLWIVRKDKSFLGDGPPYLNLILGETDPEIPPYVKKAASSSKTSIIFPLATSPGAKPDAVINFESSRHLDYNPYIEKELRSIAESIYRLYQRNRQHSKCLHDTREEIDRLRSVESYIKPAKPTLFFAFSGRAKSDIVNLVDTVLQEFDVDLRRWDQDSRLGSIHRHVYDSIKICDFGICYLSEENESERFSDNANVLIELGMFWFKNETLSNVIVIREQAEERVPFDIADKRILKVKRNRASSQLDEKDFQKEFKRMLGRMLESD
jgi:hypothetical protein